VGVFCLPWFALDPGGNPQVVNITLALCLPREGPTVGIARHICRDALVSLGVSDECVADVELAVTEACTNVLRHAASGRHEYEVQVEIDDRTCQIRVIDAGDNFHMAEEPAPAPVTAETGRGLFLMRAMVDQFDLDHEPEAGTVVKLTKELVFDGTWAARGLAVVPRDPTI
jgi:serine/threonine-protein kinase RsbW